MANLARLGRQLPVTSQLLSAGTLHRPATSILRGWPLAHQPQSSPGRCGQPAWSPETRFQQGYPTTFSTGTARQHTPLDLASPSQRQLVHAPPPPESPLHSSLPGPINPPSLVGVFSASRLGDGVSRLPVRKEFGRSQKENSQARVPHNSPLRSDIRRGALQANLARTLLISGVTRSLSVTATPSRILPPHDGGLSGNPCYSRATGS